MFRLSSPIIGLIVALNVSGAALASSIRQPLDPTWSYTYYYSSSDSWRQQEFPGISDSEGNLYWLVCNANGSHWHMWQRDCSVRSTDFDGNLRYEALIGSGWVPELSFSLHHVTGSVLVAEHNAVLTGVDASNGSVLWRRDLRGECPTCPAMSLGGVAHDGNGRIILLANSSVHALSINTGETIWRQDFRWNDPAGHVAREVHLRAVIFDESRNAFFRKDLCRRYRYDLGNCNSTIISLDPEGRLRFEREVETHALPIAVAHGRLLMGFPYVGSAEILDAETGARIARLPGNFRGGIGLISRELALLIESSSPEDAALVALDLSTGVSRWRYPLIRYTGNQALHLTDVGNILVLSDKTSLLEISPQGELVNQFLLRTGAAWSEPYGSPLLVKGRWFTELGATVFAYDLPSAPGEGRLGWNSRHGNAQGENRPREE